MANVPISSLNNRRHPSRRNERFYRDCRSNTTQPVSVPVQVQKSLYSYIYTQYRDWQVIQFCILH